jgi:hypothetical protein
MRLVAHATSQRDLAQRLGGIDHELLRHLDPPRHHVQMHSCAQRTLERPVKVAFRLSCDRRDIFYRDGTIDIFIDKLQYPPQLPCCEASSYDIRTDSRQPHDKALIVTAIDAAVLLDRKVNTFCGSFEQDAHSSHGGTEFTHVIQQVRNGLSQTQHFG